MSIRRGLGAGLERGRGRVCDMSKREGILAACSSSLSAAISVFVLEIDAVNTSDDVETETRR